MEKGIALHEIGIFISLLYDTLMYTTQTYLLSVQSKTSYSLTNFCFIAEMKMMTQENIVSSKQ